MTNDEFNVLEADCARYLSTDWAWAFLVFGFITQLGASALHRWAAAFLGASPPESRPNGKLHCTTVSQWRKRLIPPRSHGDSRNGDGLNYLVGHFRLSGNKIRSKNAALIVVFERSTQTLVHHLVKAEITPEAIWFVVCETHNRVCDRLAARNTKPPPPPFQVFLPHHVSVSLWGGVASYAKHASAQGKEPVDDSAANLAKLSWGTGQAIFSMQHWAAHEYDVPEFPQIKALHVDDLDIREVHSLLRVAARHVSRHFEQLAPNLLEKIKPSWKETSRTPRGTDGDEME